MSETARWIHLVITFIELFPFSMPIDYPVPLLHYFLVTKPINALMGDQPEYAIFPCYKPVWALHLLHLSAEIGHSISELGLQMDIDRSSGDSLKVELEFSYLKLLESRGSKLHGKQIELWDALSPKLKAYSEALLLYRSIVQLPSPHARHLCNLREYLQDTEGGRELLNFPESATWDHTRESDLVSLFPAAGDAEDAVTQFIRSTVLPWHQRLFSQRQRQRLSLYDPFTWKKHTLPIDVYPETRVQSAANVSTAILSSLIPALCSLTLFFIPTPLARMGTIIAFNFLFSIILSGVASAKKSETFAISAAFSAVLIVFVGNDITKGGKD